MTAASDLIRASITALPEGFRGRWAVSRESQVVPTEDASRFYVVANAALASPYIALMDPPVAAAVADLLDEFDLSWDRNVGIPAGIVEAVASLKAALTRTGGS